MLQKVFLFISIIFFLTGCSVYMAANQPSQRDLSVLKSGTSRAEVVSELGEPVSNETVEGRYIDVYSFRQGYSQTERISRAVLHGVGNVLTIGMWEVVGTPTESFMNGREMKAYVLYDDNQQIKSVELHSSEHGIKGFMPVDDAELKRYIEQ